MPLDPSISLQAGQGVTPIANPLDVATKFQGLANMQAQNRLIGASTDATQAGTAQTQQNMAQSGADYAARSFSQFLALPQQTQTQSTARQLTDDLLARGAISQANHDVAMNAINGTKNPDELRNLAQRALLHSQGAAATGAALYGTNATVDDGQNVIPGTASSPMQRAMQPGTPGFAPTPGSVPTYPSRATLASRVQTGTNPDGSPIMGPAANVTPPNLAGPAASPSPLGTGRLPPALRNPATASPAVPNNGNVTTGLGPAATAAQSTTGAASAGAFQQIADQAVQARTQDATLANMQADTAQFSTGPGQDRLKATQAFMQRYTPVLANAFGIKPETLAANESFDKLAAQIANAQGAGSDARLAVNQAGNPSSHLTPAGVDMILRQLRGNTDYLSARAQLAAQYPNKADREGFEAQIGTNLDPRVFQYSRMTPEQKGTYLRALPDVNKFIGAYDWAAKNNLVGGANGGQ